MPESKTTPPAAILTLATALAGCNLINPAPSLAPPLASLLPGYTLVPVPSATLLPGAVIQATAAAGGPIVAGQPIAITWLGTLADCGVPATVLATTSADVPGLQSNTSVSLDASIAAKAAGLTLGSLGANLAQNATLTISAASDVSLDYLQFAQWANNAANRTAVAAACGPKLAQPNTYVVQDAFQIAAGSYVFTNSAGGNVAVSPPSSPAGGSVSTTIGSGGTITIAKPAVFAIKTLQQLPSGSFDLAALTPVATASFGPSHHHTARPALPPPPPPAPLAPMPVSLAGTPVAAVANVPAAR